MTAAASRRQAGPDGQAGSRTRKQADCVGRPEVLPFDLACHWPACCVRSLLANGLLADPKRRPSLHGVAIPPAPTSPLPRAG